MKLKDQVSFFSFFLRSPCMKSASYEYRNKSARRGAQFVPLGMPTVCWKTRLSNIANMLSIKNILMVSVSDNFFTEWEWFIFRNKICPFIKKMYLYLHWSFFFMKHMTNSFNLSFSFEWGNSCVEKSNVLMYYRRRGTLCIL